MKIFPAIDIYGKKAVRLYKGDYAQMTVYSENPLTIVDDFIACGAKNLHLVDLEGALLGETPNFDVIKSIANYKDLFVEVGGGIRTMDRVEKYLSNGVDRVILGTSAVTDKQFLTTALKTYGEKIAVGVDVKDGFVAIRGWTEKSAYSCDEFFAYLQSIGVKTVICTDVSKDGAMKGTNRELYAELVKKYEIDVIASGGVSTLDDIESLTKLNLHGAIIGKAYYEKAIDLRRAIEVANDY